MNEINISYDHLNDNNEAPDTLYKYFPSRLASNDVIPYIETGHRVRYSQPGTLNDIYECLPNLAETDFQHLLSSNPEERELLRKEIIQRFESRGHHMTDEESESFMADVDAERALQWQTNPSSFEEDLSQYFLESINGIFSILSLTEDWDNSAMWGYYAASNTGFVLGFNAKHEALQETNLLRVQYH